MSYPQAVSSVETFYPRPVVGRVYIALYILQIGLTHYRRDCSKRRSSWYLCPLHATIETMNEPEHNRITRRVGRRIRATRRKLGLSQQDLSDLAEVHLTSLARIERGVTNPKLDMIARIATALDTTVSELVQDITPSDVDPKKRRRITAADLIRARDAEEQLAEGST